MQENNALFKIYDECCEGYHKVDDFRAKLLGFLPLASGIAILGSLSIEQKSDSSSVLNTHHFAIGGFGFMVSLGLLIYELKGIEKCTQFIKLGKWLETQMEDNFDPIKNVRKGFFIELWKGDAFFNEPIASAFIYSVVLSLWSYVSFLKTTVFCYIVPIIVFFLSFALVVYHWQKVVKTDYDLKGKLDN